MIRISPELQARMAELEAGGQARADERKSGRLEEIDASRDDDHPHHRPGIVLSVDDAERILLELKDEKPLAHIARRYGVSRRWLRRACEDDRLHRMAAGLAGKPNHPR